jgi:hypothetical protein
MITNLCKFFISKSKYKLGFNRTNIKKKNIITTLFAYISYS